MTQDARRLFVATVILSSLLFVASGCRGAAHTPSDAPLKVTVSITPQKYFVERVGGELVDVNVMVEPGASPATYEPKPEQLAALSEADAYVSIGVPFENVWLARISSANPEMLMVDAAAGIERMAMGGSAENLDPHIWLSPQLVKLQSQSIYDALVALDPQHASAYRANLDSFLADIDALDADIRATLSQVSERKFMVFHPSWGYFARDYDLEMIAIEIGGQEPSAAELAQLVTQAREENIKVIFAQPEFSTAAAKAIADEIDGEVLLISPLAPDWLNNMRQAAETFAQVLGE